MATATKSKKDTVLGFYHQKQTPEQILESCKKVGVTTTLASIKWWINDLLKGGVKKDGVVKYTQPADAIKHRPLIAEFKDLELTTKQHAALVHLFNFEDTHAILTYSDVDKVFPTEEGQKHLKFLSSHGCIVLKDGGTQCKITTFGIEMLRFPGSKVSPDQLKKNGFANQPNYGYSRTMSEIRSGKPHVPRYTNEVTINNNHSSSKSDNMSNTETAAKPAAKKKAAPAKKSAPAKKAAGAPSKKEVVRKLMKEGKGKFTAQEILDKMAKQKVTSTLASVRWYMADINAGN